MQLSKGEQITLQGLAEGLRPVEIAARQGWSHHMPYAYVRRAKKKLRCRTRTQTVVKFALYHATL